MLSTTFVMVSTIVTVFALAFAVDVGFERTTMLWAIASAMFASAVTQPLFGILADRFGRKPFFLAGAIGTGAMMFLYFGAISTGDAPLVFVAGVVMIGFFYAMPNGLYPAYFPEQFPASVRYSGMAVSLMLGLLVTGFTPAIARALTMGNPTNWLPVAWMCLICTIISAVAVITGPETYKIPTKDLGTKNAKSMPGV
ncbi:hypothetical protein ASJ79_23140 [Mycobacterium sp. NAZ190054]|nr:hypothetical protein ASJ79_23140 [Mycobacterium sp. NAZ190054]